MIRFIAFVFAVVFVAMFMAQSFGGGPTGPSTTVTLAELNAAPNLWAGKKVKVVGVVGDRVAMMGFGGMKLQDGLGNEVLIIGGDTPPKPGTSVIVEGKFMIAFAIRDLNVSVIIVN